MIYIFVLFGSFLGICAVLGVRVLLRNRSIRRFVRSVRQRSDSAEERGMYISDSPSEKPKTNPRTTSIQLQKVRSLLREADKVLSQQRIEDAERLYIQALTVDPSAYEVKAALAKLYLTSSREQKAEAMYREILQQVDDVSFHANLGLACYQQKKYMEACVSYQEALNRDSANAERYAALGKACIAAQRFQEAAPLLSKAVSRMTRDVGLLHLLAECYLQTGNTDGAEDAYRKINKLEPYNEDVKSKLKAMAEV